MNKDIRLDIILMEKSKLSRNMCQEMIKNGAVAVNGTVVTKCGFKIDQHAEIIYEIPKTIYVSRGGYKLEKALTHFNIDLNDKICVDVGASTGGFTDCMLQNNAKKVFAVDTGSEQLVEKIKLNEKVQSFENTNISDICESLSAYKIDFVCVDVSFVSLTKISLPIAKLVKKDSTLVTLIKPQFEAGKKYLNKKGIVKDKKIHADVVDKVVNCFIELGFSLKGVIPSPIKGSCGNEEFLAFFIYTDAFEVEAGVL